MKKTDWIFLISVLLFSFLFWKQMPGLNASIFTAALLGGQVLMNRDMLRNRSWIFAALGALCSSFCVFNFGSSLSMFATIFSMLLASYFAFAPKGSVLMGAISSMTSVFVSIAFMIMDTIKRQKAKVENPSGNKSGKKLLIVIIALAVVLIFFLMYRESSIMFYNLTQKINLDFISLPWMVFTLFGALVIYGFYYHNSFDGIGEWDGKHALKLSPDREENWLDKLMSMDSEQFSGIVLFSLLNILLLVVNSLDAISIFGNSGSLPQGVSCMQYVHQGVGMLITSIVFAMLIILYYFRGRMNFAANGKWLRLLAVIWIAQNAFMLYSTFWRNDVYILAFGLTYKRIGVFIYLLLTLIGLFVTAWKVYGKKTNAFLIRTNSWLFYGVWVIACFVNWDKMIFENNVSISKSPDFAYLSSLSNNILPELVQFTKSHPYVLKNGNEASNFSSRIYTFLDKQKWLRDECKWPSFQLNANSNYNLLKDETGFGNLNVNRKEVKEIYFFRGFENATNADFSDNDLVDLGEIGSYKNLEVLNVSYNPQLVSLVGVEQLSKLKILYIQGTHITDLSPLLKLRNLETICINNNMDVDLQKQLLEANPKLKINNNY